VVALWWPDMFSFFAANFYPIAREGSLGGPTDEQLFARQRFLCPAMGLSHPDMSLCYARTRTSCIPICTNQRRGEFTTSRF
jgi:hypothetical protein